MLRVVILVDGSTVHGRIVLSTLDTGISPVHSVDNVFNLFWVSEMCAYTIPPDGEWGGELGHHMHLVLLRTRTLQGIRRQHDRATSIHRLECSVLKANGKLARRHVHCDGALAPLLHRIVIATCVFEHMDVTVFRSEERRVGKEFT